MKVTSHGKPGSKSRPSLIGAPAARRSLRWLAILTLTALGSGTVAASASAGSPPIKFGGNPLTVYVNEVGRCQSSYAAYGGNYYPGYASYIEAGGLADCGFFLATPNAPSSGAAPQPLDLQGPEEEVEGKNIRVGRVFGFNGEAGPRGFAEPSETTVGKLNYVPVTNEGPTGSGTAADPFKVVTVYDAYVGTTKYFEVTQTTEYVSGNSYFTVNFDVKNVSSSTVYYRAIYAGDLFVNGSDTGTGVFLGGPPRFVGGQNQTSGVLGGFQEDLQTFNGEPTPPWTSFAEDYWDATFPETLSEPVGGIWHYVETSANAALSGSNSAFPNTVSPKDWDNGAGVAWDTNYTEGHGLAPGADQKYAIVNFTTIPSTLQVSPTSQGLPQGATATITVTALNNGGQPYPSTPLRYTITGANPQTGSVVTNAQGIAQIHYVGANAGADLVSMYLDLGNTAAQVAADPTGTAQVTFVPAPPNSGVTIQSVKVNSNGSITITYIPTEAGTGTLTVTVPTASVARKHKKCLKGQVKIKGRCLPRTSVVGVATGNGAAGVPLTLTVKPSGKAVKALHKGRRLHVTATLTYQSAKGGTPTAHVYNLTLKGKSKRKHRK